MSEAVCTDVRNRLHNVGAVRRGRRGCVSSKLWSRSTVYTTFTDAGLPPQVEITHSAKAEAEAFARFSETYPYVSATFERTTWILGLQVMARGDLRTKAGHLAAAAN